MNFTIKCVDAPLSRFLSGSGKMQLYKEKMFDFKLALVTAILFFAATFRTVFGFGEALISLPLLALFIPVRVAAPLAVLASVIIAGFIVIRDWRHIHFRSAGWLVLSTLVGLPLGLVVLKILPEPLVKSILGVLLLFFSFYSLFQKRSLHLRSDRFAWIFGFCAGVLGGSYGLNGPPLALYGSLRQWSPEKFRATLQAYFLPASALGICGYWVAGLWTQAVFHLAYWTIPATAAGIFAGRILRGKIAPSRFYSFVYVSLIAVSAVLLVQNL